MMMMKMKLLLFLSCVLCVCADVQHEDFHILGCSKSDGEDMYAVDGEELWYADFTKKTGVDTQPNFIDHMSFQEGTYQQAEANQQICKSNLDIHVRIFKDTPPELDPPSSPMIYIRDKVEVGEKNILICHVSGFYPAPVKVRWTKNGETVTEGSNINVPYFSKEGVFTQTSRLEMIPQQGDIYSCSVEHPALKQPLTTFWDVEVQQPAVGPAVFCGLGLTVGLLGVAAGTFFLIKGNECS